MKGMDNKRTDSGAARSKSETGPTSGTYGSALLRLKGAQKPSAGTPLYSRVVNRPLGRYIAAGAYVLGWTPNTVTFVSAVFTFTGITLVALVRPTWWLGIAVSALLVIGYALDSADGQLARLRGGGSIQGEWLDHVVDAGKVVALHSAVLIAAFRFFDVPTPWLLVPLGYLFVDTLIFFAMLLKDLLARTVVAKPQGSTASSGLVRAILILPSDYGFICLMFLLLGSPLLFFSVYSVLFVSNAVILVAVLIKWYRYTGAL